MTSYEYLMTYCEEISAKEFYRGIFPEGELEEKGVYETGKYTGIAVSVNDQSKKVKRYSITDDLEAIDELCSSDDFSLMSPISYAGKSRKSENARFLYAMAIDLDGLKEEQYEGEPIGIATLFYQFDGHGPSNYLPKPTYIVASGTGLHLYYVFEKPIPLFRNIVEQLEVLKRRLTWQLWTQGVSDLQNSVQYESLFQGFRVPGTVTKDGKRAKAFVVDSGEKVTVDYLNAFVPEEYRVQSLVYKSKLTLKKAEQKYPEWFEKRIVKGEKRGRWTCKRDLYDWWKRKLESGAEDGHRYWCIQVLSVYAVKCGIPREELEKDAFGYIDLLHERGKRKDNPFTSNDVLKALESYNDSYVTYPIDTISDRTGIRIEKNKRNGRKQAVHLERARAVQNIDYPDGEWREGNGRKPQKETVREWREKHPEGKKADCIRETGLDKKTVYRWWNEVEELLQKQRSRQLPRVDYMVNTPDETPVFVETEQNNGKFTKKAKEYAVKMTRKRV